MFVVSRPVRVLVCVVLAMSLPACGGGSGESADSSPAAAAAAPAVQLPDPITSNNSPADNLATPPPPPAGDTAGAPPPGSTPANNEPPAAEPTPPPAASPIVAQASLEDTLRSCGNEGESACGLLGKDRWNGRCDTGLQSVIERCGCLVHGLLGNCLVPQLCEKCRNDTRHRSATAARYAASWEHWALKNQREELALDEPINWVMHLGTHNAFNSFSDGHQARVVDPPLSVLPRLGVLDIVDAPNQFYSMSTQMDLGSRMLALDAHWVGALLEGSQNARLCHSLADVFDSPEASAALESAICVTPDLESGGGLFPGMRYFANGIKEIRNWLDRHPDAIVILNLENYVGQTPETADQKAFIVNPLRAYLDGPGRQWILPVPADSSLPLPSRAELLAQGKRVVLIIKGAVDPALGLNEYTVVERGENDYKTWLRNNQDFDNCVDNIGNSANAGPATAGPGKFSVVVEDRTLQSGFIQLLEAFGTGPGAFGQLTVDDMRKVARCNYTIVAADFLGSALPLGREADLPDFNRHAALVWSWKPGDRGQNGDCAMIEGISGRWVSADCAQPKRYVCAPPRSESGTEDRSQWNTREDRWVITQAAGTWQGGAAACAAEFPLDPVTGTPLVFSVPVNGYQNTFAAAHANGEDVWLNYTDQDREGRWVIPKIANLNAPPVADAGADQDLECGCKTVLDAGASTDPDGDPLSFTWSGFFGTLTGQTATVELPAGVHVITLTVSDGRGGVSSDAVSITITDSKKPKLTVKLSPSVLSPVKDQMVKVVAEVQAKDACDSSQVLIELVSIVDDSIHGRCDANHVDIQDAEPGTGDLEFSLRAERAKHGDAREYRVTYRATDAAGNSTKAHAKVLVPKKKPKKGD